MGARWTAEQVLGLAPDSASVAAGRKLAAPATWSRTGDDEDAVWGLAKGSGKNPYQTAVDLSGPAYKCSCPSRKIPCKHVLGLLLLWADGRLAREEAERPEYVREWLDARGERAEAAGQRAVARARKEADPEAQERRRQKRSEAIAAGLDDLERFLGDLVRHGLANARELPASAWDAQARRLVDAQAPALAARVHRLAATVHGGRESWPARALEQAGALHAVARAWRRGDALPADLRDDLRAVVGWPRTAEEVRAASAAQAGPWAVVGVRLEDDGRLRTRRTWLLRLGDRRPALLLDFAAGGAPLPAGLVLGTVVDGAVHPHPGRGGLRVVLAGDEALRTVGDWDGPTAGDTIDRALASWGAAVAADPFVARLPVVLAEVTPVRARGTWWLRDAEGAALPLALAPGGEPPWALVALAGGAPLGVAAEWDGGALRPLCAHAGGRLARLGCDGDADADAAAA